MAKFQRPETVDDLVDYFYNPDRQEDRRRYEDYAGGIMANTFEALVGDILGLKLNKIPERPNVKTPDFVSEDKATVVEVTTMKPSFEPSYCYDSSQFDLVKEINAAIDHAEEKDLDYLSKCMGMDRSSYQFVLVVRVDFKIVQLFQNNNFDEIAKAIVDTRFKISDLDVIVFCPDPIAGLKQPPAIAIYKTTPPSFGSSMRMIQIT